MQGPLRSSSPTNLNAPQVGATAELSSHKHKLMPIQHSCRTPDCHCTAPATVTPCNASSLGAHVQRGSLPPSTFARMEDECLIVCTPTFAHIKAIIHLPLYTSAKGLLSSQLRICSMSLGMGLPVEEYTASSVIFL